MAAIVGMVRLKSDRVCIYCGLRINAHTNCFSFRSNNKKAHIACYHAHSDRKSSKVRASVLLGLKGGF